MTTSSTDVGTWAADQFAALNQLLSVAPVQEIAAASASSASAERDRKAAADAARRRRDRRCLLGNEDRSSVEAIGGLPLSNFAQTVASTSITPETGNVNHS